MKASGDFSIGSQVWPGTSKLIEEMGELQQVLGKLMATAGDTAHWSGDLRQMLIDELADVSAAVRFFSTENFTREQLLVILERADKKLALFQKWHADPKPPPEPANQSRDQTLPIPRPPGVTLTREQNDQLLANCAPEPAKCCDGDESNPNEHAADCHGVRGVPPEPAKVSSVPSCVRCGKSPAQKKDEAVSEGRARAKPCDGIGAENGAPCDMRLPPEPAKVDPRYPKHYAELCTDCEKGYEPAKCHGARR